MEKVTVFFSFSLGLVKAFCPLKNIKAKVLPFGKKKYVRVGKRVARSSYPRG